MIIPFIEGDGIGPDIWRATRQVLDAALIKTYGNEKKLAPKIEWVEILAGGKAHRETGEWLPQKTLDAIREYQVAIKGPLTTPIGGGIRSINVAMRQILDLYACIRPIRYFKDVPSPLKNPERLNVVIFRENTEDVYAGIEWAAGTKEAQAVRAFLVEKMGAHIREKSAIGIKPISEFGSKRLVRMALQYAKEHHRPSVTFVHKGNIMKFTEGAFSRWAYDVAREEFGNDTITEEILRTKYKGERPKNKIVVNDRIADAMFQLVLHHPSDYHVIATSNLNGDYLSDACASQVGGLGIAPGANIGDHAALFEATHGTAPDHADKDEANPTSLILSGVMMLEHLGWKKAGDLIVKGIERTIADHHVTFDLARQLKGAKKIKCSRYAEEVIKNM